MRAVNHYNEKRWFALCTKPRCELKARNQLDSIDAYNYLPLITRFSKWSDRIKKIEEPLIRGYIFVFADERERLLSLEQPSIVKCVCHGGRAACIPCWQIENLQKINNIGTDLRIQNGLVSGEKAEIISGPLKGVIGTIENIGCKNRLAVSIDILNRSVIVRLTDESLLKAIQ